MASHYVTTAADFSQAVYDLHAVIKTITKAHPGKVQGDAHLIFEDVCALIEHLGKVEAFPIKDRSKIAAAMFVLAQIENRAPVLQAAE